MRKTTAVVLWIAGCAVLVAVATFVLTTGKTPHTTGRSRATEMQSPSDSRMAPIPSLGRGHRREVRADERTWKVLSLEGERPISGVEIYTVSKNVFDTMSMEAPAIATSAEDGGVEIDEAGLPVALIHPDYLPIVVERPPASRTILLEAGKTLRVIARNEFDRPLVGAVFALRRASQQGPMDIGTGSEGIGDPRSDTPMWIGRTDENGVATFSSLPSYSYSMLGAHRHSFPVSRSATMEAPITPPGTVRVDFLRYYGLAASAPPGLEIREASFSAPPSDLSIGPQINLAYVRAVAADRFPESEIWIGRPIAPAKATVRCTATLNGGISASLELPPVPLEDLQHEAFLVPESEPPGRARINVAYESGARIPFRVRILRDDRFHCYAQANEEISLPSGNYDAWPARLHKYGGDFWTQTEFTVTPGPGGPVAQITNTVPDDFRYLRIHPSWEGDFDNVIHFLVKPEGHQTSGFLNWGRREKERDVPLLLLVPVGKVSIESDGRGGVWEDRQRIEVDVLPGETPLDVDFTIERKKTE